MSIIIIIIVYNIYSKQVYCIYIIFSQFLVEWSIIDVFKFVMKEFNVARVWKINIITLAKNKCSKNMFLASKKNWTLKVQDQ